MGGECWGQTRGDPHAIYPTLPLGDSKMHKSSEGEFLEMLLVRTVHALAGRVHRALPAPLKEPLKSMFRKTIVKVHTIFIKTRKSS